MNRSFLEANVDDLLKHLTLEEKVNLISAPDWWNTSKIHRLNIPSLRLSDGPNGVRGSSHLISTPAQCLPCATALASSFDPTLAYRVGQYLALEAKAKSATVLLAPTCNIQRSPLGGRSFESFSEDPFLSGTLAAAYVNGLQSNGAAATIKHFVANDQEHERTAVSSEVSDRALREVYLYPFMVAQRDARPWAYMTAYNRLNGLHCAENPLLLRSILRSEWGFDGLVMSDWFGTYSVSEAIEAGLDLEMPGPPRWRNLTLVNACLGARKLTADALDDRVRGVLNFVQKVAKWGPKGENAEIVYGDGKEGTIDTPQRREEARRLAAEGCVLLKNEKAVLPIEKGAKKVAVIGPNADAKVISGGGSAALKPTYVVNPLRGLVDNAPAGVDITYSVGSYAHKFLPTLEDMITTPSGEPGWTITFYNHDSSGEPLSKPLDSFTIPDTKVRLNDFLPKGLTPGWTTRHKGYLTSKKDMQFEIGLAVAGKARVWVGGKMVIELWEEQEPGEFYYGQGSAEEKAVVSLKAGSKTEVEVEYTNVMPKYSKRSNMQPALMRGFRLGGVEKIDPETALADAVELAKKSDVAIVVVGLNPDWESEGFDRKDLKLPMDQDKLVKAVAGANPKTVVVVQAGSAISMPWLSDVAGLLYAWYGGNECGNAIADIVYGRVEPSGRLPLTLPAREEDVPAFLNFGSEAGKVHYREDLFVGYKWYQARGLRPLFPFGFGLSYSSSQVDELRVSKPVTSPKFSVTISAKVINTGNRPLREVVQVYVEYPPLRAGLTTPRLQLRGFAKSSSLAPGTSEVLKVELDRYSVAFWDVRMNGWKVEKGVYKVFVGKSSEELSLAGEVEVESDMSWVGI